MIKDLINETAEEAVPLISGKIFNDALKMTGWQIAQPTTKIIIDSVTKQDKWGIVKLNITSDRDPMIIMPVPEITHLIAPSFCKILPVNRLTSEKHPTIAP